MPLAAEGDVVTRFDILSIESRIAYVVTLSDPFGATSPRGGGLLESYGMIYRKDMEMHL